MFYQSEILIFNEKKTVPIVIRNYGQADFDEMIRLQSECFPPPYSPNLWWNKEQLTNHISRFPIGAICVEVDGVLAGSMTSLRVQFDSQHPSHTWSEITDDGYIRNHNPEGNTLYIVDVCISPRYRKLGLGKLMMQAMYQIVIQLRLDRLLGGGRMPGYSKHANHLSAHQYIEEVLSGKLKDPVLTFLLRCGRTPLALVENYLDDEESHNYGLLMQWENPFNSQGKGE